MQLEVGYIEAHPLAYAGKMLKTVWRTWRFTRARGMPCNRWYDAYEKGSETVVAHFGPLPDAESNARRFVDSGGVA